MKEVVDPRSPIGTTQMPVLEPERRKKHIDLIDPTHPLLPIALACLEYRERDRPLAEELCQRLADLKENQEYIKSSQNTTPATPEVNGTLQQERDELARRVEENNRVLATKDQQIAIKDQEIAAKDQEIAAANDRGNQRLVMQLQELNQRLVNNEQATVQFQETIQQLQRQNQDLQMQVESLRWPLKMVPKPPKEIVLQWRGRGRAPFSVARSSSVVFGNVVYFCSDNKVYCYDSSSGRWSTLPKCPQRSGGLVVVKGLLTMVGGNHLNSTNKLVSLLDCGKWVEQFPPMTRRRNHVTATTYQNHLIVAGGSSSDFVTDNTDTVEVLSTDTLPPVWSIAASLPHPFASGSSTIINDRLYMLGGNDRKDSCRSVFSCSLPELIQSCKALPKVHVWQCDARVPVYGSTCATVYGQLVAIGGKDEHNDVTTAVFQYNRNTHSWSIISHMATARRSCCVAVVDSTNQLIVVGGKISKSTDVVEIAEY